MCTIAFALCTRHRCTGYQYWDGSDAQYVLRERESLASGQVRYSNGACIPVQRNPVVPSDLARLTHTLTLTT